MNKTINKENAEHYFWGENCDGWHLLKRDDLSVIQERVPPGQAEIKHYHRQSRQFFFIIEGEATIEIGAEKITLRQHEGIEVPPLIPHQFRNESDRDAVFLVISAPKSHGDRENITT